MHSNLEARRHGRFYRRPQVLSLYCTTASATVSTAAATAACPVHGQFMQYGVGDVLLSSCHLVSSGARRLVRDVASAFANSAALSYTCASSVVSITISPRAYTAHYTLPPSYTVAAIISTAAATSCSASYQPKNVLV